MRDEEEARRIRQNVERLQAQKAEKLRREQEAANAPPVELSADHVLSRDFFDLHE